MESWKRNKYNSNGGLEQTLKIIHSKWRTEDNIETEGSERVGKVNPRKGKEKIYFSSI